MKKYEMVSLQSGDYQYFFVMLVCESILNYLSDLNRDISDSCQTKILVDQLLTTGDNKNRFIECSVTNGQIDLSTAKNVDGNQQIRCISQSILSKHGDVMFGSVLSKKFIANFKAGTSR